MNEYIVTSVCGDTVNIPTYDVVSCDEEDLIPHLDRHYFDWRDSQFIKIFQVSKELDKWELGEKRTKRKRKYSDPSVKRSYLTTKKEFDALQAQRTPAQRRRRASVSRPMVIE